MFCSPSYSLFFVPLAVWVAQWVLSHWCWWWVYWRWHVCWREWQTVSCLRISSNSSSGLLRESSSSCCPVRRRISSPPSRVFLRSLRTGFGILQTGIRKRRTTEVCSRRRRIGSFLTICVTWRGPRSRAHGSRKREEPITWNRLPMLSWSPSISCTRKTALMSASRNKAAAAHGVLTIISFRPLFACPFSFVELAPRSCRRRRIVEIEVRSLSHFGSLTASHTLEQCSEHWTPWDCIPDVKDTHPLRQPNPLSAFWGLNWTVATVNDHIRPWMIQFHLRGLEKRAPFLDSCSHQELEIWSIATCCKESMLLRMQYYVFYLSERNSLLVLSDDAHNPPPFHSSSLEPVTSTGCQLLWRFDQVSSHSLLGCFCGDSLHVCLFVCKEVVFPRVSFFEISQEVFLSWFNCRRDCDCSSYSTITHAATRQGQNLFTLHFPLISCGTHQKPISSKECLLQNSLNVGECEWWRLGKFNGWIGIPAGHRIEKGIMIC